MIKYFMRPTENFRVDNFMSDPKIDEPRISSVTSLDPWCYLHRKGEVVTSATHLYIPSVYLEYLVVECSNTYVSRIS